MDIKGAVNYISMNDRIQIIEALGGVKGETTGGSASASRPPKLSEIRRDQSYEVRHGIHHRPGSVRDVVRRGFSQGAISV